MRNSHRVLFSTGMHFDDIMNVDHLSYKYFVSIVHFSLVGNSIGIAYNVIKGVPPDHSNLHLSGIQIYEMIY